MCDIVDKLYKLKNSPLMAEEIIGMAARYLSFSKTQQASILQKRMYASKMLRKSLENLSQNIVCPETINEIVHEALL